MGYLPGRPYPDILNNPKVVGAQSVLYEAAKITPSAAESLQKVNAIFWSICNTPRAYYQYTDYIHNERNKLAKFLSRYMQFVQSRDYSQLDGLVSLFAQYNQALMKLDKYRDYYDTQDANIINCIELVKRLGITGKVDAQIDQNLFDGIKRYQHQTGFYGYVPPFETGILRLSDIYVVRWEVVEFNVEQQSITIQYWPFVDAHKLGLECVIPHEPITGRYTMPEDRRFCGYTMATTFQQDIDKSAAHFTNSDILSTWTKPSRTMWDRTVVEFARILDKEWQYRIKYLQKGAFPYAHYVAFFMSELFNGINYILSQNTRPKVKNTQRKDSAEPTIHILDLNKEPARAPQVRKLRTYGIIDITSIKVPKPMNEKRIYHFRTACWSTRGHIRRYKSGKVIYIEPHLNRRKGVPNSVKVEPTKRIMIVESPPPSGGMQPSDDVTNDRMLM